MITGFFLASLNATLNGLAAINLGLGFRAVHHKELEKHRKYMLAAFACSALFLISYGARIVMFGDTVFTGEGPVRYVYFAILISHVILAIVALPLVLRTLALGLKNRVVDHQKMAKYTLPIWGYVSITGVIVYLMLYHFPGR